MDLEAWLKPEISLIAITAIQISGAKSMGRHQQFARTSIEPPSMKESVTTSLFVMEWPKSSPSMMSQKAMAPNTWNSTCGEANVNMVLVIMLQKPTALVVMQRRPDLTSISRRTWRKRGGNFEDKVLKVGESCNDFELQFVSFSHL